MQSFQLVRGLYDTEIQEKILAEAANRELKLSEIVKLAEAMEAGKRSSGVLSRSGGLNRLSKNDRKVDSSKKKCRYCGETWHEGSDWKKQCRGTLFTCLTCNKRGHVTEMCRSSKKQVSKQNNAIEAEPTTPPPQIDGEAANIGFFYHMTANGTKLSHVGIDQFGQWAKIKVEDHPEVEVELQPDFGGYDQLGLAVQLPNKLKMVKSKALADIGAQMVIIGIRVCGTQGI